MKLALRKSQLLTPRILLLGLSVISLTICASAGAAHYRKAAWGDLWRSKGSGDSQFDDPISVAVDPNTNKVYVADPRNKRIQVFDSDGKFLARWPVPEWGQPLGYEDLVVDPTTGRLYACSANINSILMFNSDGTRLGSVTPNPPSKLDGPSSLAVAGRKLYVLNIAGNRVTVIDL